MYPHFKKKFRYVIVIKKKKKKNLVCKKKPRFVFENLKKKWF